MRPYYFFLLLILFIKNYVNLVFQKLKKNRIRVYKEENIIL